MTKELEALLTELYVLIDDHVVPPRHGRGRRPELSDSELLCLAVAQMLLGFHSERRWVRHAQGNAEVGDWDRLTGSSIGAYLGLVPTESSSGQSRSQGSITKTGNTHARRLLVEAAWHHRKPYRTPGATMRARWELAPAAARARGHAGNQRLHQRWLHFTDRKKRPVVANVAIARELAGWCWSLAVMND